MSNGASAASSTVEQRVDEARDRLDASLDALQRKFSPGQMVDEAMSFFREGSGADFGRNLTRSVREQPMPVILVGVGLAWLMFTSSGSQSSSGTTSHLGGQAQRAGETASERARQASGALQDQASSIGQGISEQGRNAAAGVQSGARSLSNAGSETMALLQRQPLLAAAFGVTAGAVLASLFPSTDAERDLLAGPLETARGQAEELGQKASRIAGQATDAAKDAARDEQERGRGEHEGETSSHSAREGDTGIGTRTASEAGAEPKPTSPFSS